MPSPTISVVVCAYNEQATVGEVLGRLKTLDFVSEIVVVNNGSKDNTGSIMACYVARDPRFIQVDIPQNRGLGFGLVAGIQRTTGDIVVRQDADLEYDPAEIQHLIEPLLKGYANVCFGSRVLVRKAHRAQYFYNYLANILFTFISNLLSNLNLTDVETAAKAFDGPLIRSLKFVSKGFEIEIEMLYKLRAAGAVFYEVPISYYGRTVEEGKKIRLKDAFATFFAIFRFGLFWSFKKSARIQVSRNL